MFIMKRISTLDIVVRVAIVLIIAGILYTAYMYRNGQFGH